MLLQTSSTDTVHLGREFEPLAEMCSSTLEHNPYQRCCSISFTPLLACSFGKIAVCRCDRARLSRGCHLRETAPCLARQAITPVEASLSLLLQGLLSLLLRGLSSLTRVSSLVLLVSQHSLFCEHARTHSSVEHTSAVSTVTVRDPCDQSSSSPRATSSRSPCITVSSYSSSSPGVLLPLTAHGFGSHSSIGTVTDCIGCPSRIAGSGLRPLHLLSSCSS